ncbi:hypothetical protein [Gelidibacter sp.]|uniref:hypothetical protein n=1 Tax=Gelidibacter sp. TaxID=2018083 RepID=UPI002CA6B92A|nr:hypothetical protein [Gelidibacter sp.]HUH26657.1 hypothetical protein [Gelidibacter sp.]
MKQENFKPQFLFKDDVAMTKEETKVINGAKKLNDFINQIESTLSLTLTNREKEAIQANGLKPIYDDLKTKFPFPNASNEFNLQALGIDLKPLERLYIRSSAMWCDYNYQLNKEGVFEATKEALKNAIDRHIYYTTNDNQNLALKLAKELELMFSNVETAGHLKKYNRNIIEEVTGLLEYSFDKNKQLRIQPDFYYIKNLK